jgi:hypothetical protein
VLHAELQPTGQPGPTIHAWVASNREDDHDRLQRALRVRLPDYMVPLNRPPRLPQYRRWRIVSPPASLTNTP